MRKPIDLEKARISMPSDKIEEVKRELCLAINRLASRRGWEGKNLAAYLGVSRSTVSRINRHRFGEISLNQLFRYLARLHPGFRLLILP